HYLQQTGIPAGEELSLFFSDGGYGIIQINIHNSGGTAIAAVRVDAADGTFENLVSPADWEVEVAEIVTEEWLVTLKYVGTGSVDISEIRLYPSVGGTAFAGNG